MALGRTSTGEKIVPSPPPNASTEVFAEPKSLFRRRRRKNPPAAEKENS